MKFIQKMRKYKNLWGYVYVAPALLVVAFVMLVPLCYTLVLSFFKTDLYTGTNTFVWFNQFIKLFKHDVFQLATKNTLVWTFGSVVLQFLIGFTLANILNWKRIRGKSAIRILLMVPWVLPSIVSAMVWQWSYHADFGIINEIAKRLGLIAESVNWLSSPETALFAAMVVNVWKMVPFVILMTEAALQGVSHDLKEAAMVDGATGIKVFWYITLPGIRSTITTVILLLTIWTMNSFTFIYVLTEGGPVHRSEILSMYIYRTAFKNYEFGAASAAATTLFIITAAIALVYNRYVIGKEND